MDRKVPAVKTDSKPASPRFRTAFVWHGLPAYGAHLLRGAIDTNRAEISIIATRPDFSTVPIDQILPNRVQWHSARQPISWTAVPGGLPDLAIVTGWGFPFCRRLAKEAAAADVPVVMMSDNRWRGDLRQWCGRFVYRSLHAKTFRGGWVPGASAAKVLREFGVPEDRIFPCLYGSNPAIFRPTLPLAARGQTIVFVGQMTRRKGVDVLIEAFRGSELAQRGWRLQMFGSGPLSQLARSQPGVTYREFSPPDVIAQAVGIARIFVMPSRDDNWPLALHEATASGCLLLTTTAVGSCRELIGNSNGVVVKPGNAQALAAGLIQLAEISGSQLYAAEAESLAKASGFGPAAFAASFKQICDQLGPAGGHKS
jgi:glycosyltransferase involved in cell wall biosynthesis